MSLVRIQPPLPALAHHRRVGHADAGLHVAVGVGVAFLGEGISWNEPLGGLVVLFGVAIAQGRLRWRVSAPGRPASLRRPRDA